MHGEAEGLFHAWLPRSSYEPTGDPTMEVYRRSPVELGWETFDNDCCLPVRPLRCRKGGAVEAVRQAGFLN